MVIDLRNNAAFVEVFFIVECKARTLWPWLTFDVMTGIIMEPGNEISYIDRSEKYL
jgi:hypothetical protein